MREVMFMSGPIILGMFSFTVMEFFDKAMVSYVGTDALAAVGSAGIGSYTLSTLYMGIISVVSTFVAQCHGRGEKHLCARYCWQGIYLSLLGILFTVVLWPLSEPLVAAMRHTPEVTRLELDYFRTRLAGYVFIGVSTAMAGFFQAINRSRIPRYAAIFGNVLNLGFNYLLIFGKFGFPRMEVTGAALATVISTLFQAAFLSVVFSAAGIMPNIRHALLFDWNRIRELFRIGLPRGDDNVFDVAKLVIFVSFIVGYFGAVQLAANAIVLGFMHVCFMPAVGLNHGIAAIVGQWLGRGEVAQRRAPLPPCA